MSSLMKASAERTLTGSSQGSRPKTRRSPCGTGRRPERACSNVVLPAPFGPTRPTTCPAARVQRGISSRNVPRRMRSPLTSMRSVAVTLFSFRQLGSAFFPEFALREQPLHEPPERQPPNPQLSCVGDGHFQLVASLRPSLLPRGSLHPARDKRPRP